MHEYYRIKESVSALLKQAGFAEESSNNEVDYCGSIHTVFVSGDNRVLLAWDGKDGFGYAEVWKNKGRHRLSTKVLEAKETEFQEAIELLCAELKGYV